MTGSPRSCRGGWKTGARASTGTLAALLLTVAPLSGQATVRADVEENFRREPQGQVLARVNADAELLRVGASGSWTEASLEGWVWTASLQTTGREGLSLAVSSAGGENLRAAPSGAIVARLEEGMLLEELERRPGWTRVRRTGWIWSASVTRTEAVQSTTGAAAEAGGFSGRGSQAAPLGTDPARTFLRAGEGAPILSAPDGDTIGTSSIDGDLEVLAREGSWVRVRLEGWVWSPVSDAGDAEPSSGAAGVADLTPDDLAAPDGASHEGRRVTWTVQFISLERAEAVRTDFYEDEPFILDASEGPRGRSSTSRFPRTGSPPPKA